MKQQTLQSELKIKGIGLHSGLESIITLKPLKQNSGVWFEKNGIKMKALYSQVKDTTNCTLLEKDGVAIATIEHLMAALYHKGIDNVLVECSASELPILDGSAEQIINHLNAVAIQEQDAQRHFLKVIRPVKFEDDKGNFIELSPSRSALLHIFFEIFANIKWPFFFLKIKKFEDFTICFNMFNYLVFRI